MGAALVAALLIFGDYLKPRYFLPRILRPPPRHGNRTMKLN
jgi:hypothetical protein